MQAIQYHEIVDIQEFKKILMEKLVRVHNLANSLKNNTYDISGMVFKLDDIAADAKETQAVIDSLDTLHFYDYKLLDDNYNETIVLIKSFLESVSRANENNGENNDNV